MWTSSSEGLTFATGSNAPIACTWHSILKTRSAPVQCPAKRRASVTAPHLSAFSSKYERNGFLSSPSSSITAAAEPDAAGGHDVYEIDSTIVHVRVSLRMCSGRRSRTRNNAIDSRWMRHPSGRSRCISRLLPVSRMLPISP